MKGTRLLCPSPNPQLARHYANHPRHPPYPATSRLYSGPSGAIQDASRADPGRCYARSGAGIGVDVVEQACPWGAALYDLAFVVRPDGYRVDRECALVWSCASPIFFRLPHRYDGEECR